MEDIVDLQEIEKSYPMGNENIHVLKKVSLSVKQGDYLAILGASGSGKSTLMNIIGCMDTPDAGSYFLAGVDVLQCSDRELTALRNHKIGFIFQKYHLIPQYTILQNVILPLLVQGKGRGEATQIAEKYIRMVGLWDRISHKPQGAFWRPAAASSDCPGVGCNPRFAVGRRAHRRVGFQNWTGNSHAVSRTQ